MSTPTSATIDRVGAIALPSAGGTLAAAGDRRVAHASTDLLRFAGLMAQLALLLAVFALYRVEEGGFLRLVALSFGAFAIHYWLPFAWKESWWIGVSAAGAALLLGPTVAGLVFAAGLVIYGVVAAPIAYRWRLTLVLALAAAAMYGRATTGFGVPWQFWPAFGAIFMFRLMIYMYDVRFSRTKPNLREFCVYFFPLPNFYFLLFPVIDFQTLRRTYYQRDIHAIAQQGIAWMVRGAVQLSIYRLIYHLKPPFSPAEITSLPALFAGMVAVYLLYLRVSGQFHIIIGLMHLFGYDLPETHRKYLLASSLADFWRRINIYWKDFMVKLVYFPVYFRLRKKGDTMAQVVATAAVFVATWALHSYQWFWLQGTFLLTWPDTLFWTILGVLVIVNLLIEQRRRKKKKTADTGFSMTIAAKTVATFTLIVVLWSLWNSATVGNWLEVITWWQIG
jgi:D-alanyl-lipoteichoic acid acyltransferase DltB (MBOAT superfamily)